MPVVMETTMTPTARAPVEISAIAESPLTWLVSRSLSRKKAAATTTGIATRRGAAFMADAIARAPKPTWDNPSPIME